MWVEINQDIFEGDDFRSLNDLIQFLTRKSNSNIQRYNLFVEYSLIEHSKLYKELHRTDQDILIAEYNTYINESSTNGEFIKYVVTYSPSTSTQFNIEEASRFFNQHVAIILENSKNDAYFIEAIIKHFDEEKIVIEHVKQGWIQFENAGGCTNVQNLIEGKLKSYNYLASKNGKKEANYFRGMILLDGDKEYPTQEQKEEYKILEKYFQDNAFVYHFLEKRMMESYMPNDVYEHIREREPRWQKWIDAYKALSEVQKDYLNHTIGFPKKEKSIKNEIKALYASLSEEHFNVLNKGFDYPKFKSKFPEFFDDALVNKDNLKKRANSDELERILQKIKDLL